MGFLANFFGSLGVLAVPLLLALSIVFVVLIERIIFFTIVFKKEGAISNIEAIIIKNKSYPKHLREDFIEIELDDIERSIVFGLNLLKFIASVATMLGLLGTIVGMIEIFSSISTVKTAVSPAVISAGIQKAMYTTAYGLVIAIFALMVHYVFENIGTKIFSKIEEYAVLLNTTTEYERLKKINSHNTNE
jgi:biopolymer transport protein ExbB/TolQ